MTLLTGDALDPKRFFEGGNPQVQASTIDLTIGCIFDHEGKKVEGPFTIKPGHMVQVVSAEQLTLSDRVTGHVTYKTSMTRQGIWALTVGIVDPGWHGPIATTLLNFSSVAHCVAEGDAFLRVSLFEHDAVAPGKLRKAPPLDAYLKDVQKIAASRFPATFLDTSDIAEKAGKNVLSRIRVEALGWVAGIALVFTLLQVIINLFTGSRASVTEIERLHSKIEFLQSNISKLERSGSPGGTSSPHPASSAGVPGFSAPPSLTTTPAAPKAELPTPQPVPPSVTPKSPQ